MVKTVVATQFNRETCETPNDVILAKQYSEVSDGF
jgi:hypothetical protein